MTSLNYQIATNGGQTFGAYVSRPDQPNGNAIVLLQEIFGVTSTIRRVADRYAQDGYEVYAPDLFWRIEAGIELSHSREDIQRAMSLMKQFDENCGLSDIAETVAHIRGLPDFQGKVAVAGLCMGGRLSYLASARLNIDAAVGYYGVGIEHDLDEVEKLQCPIILHFGREDEYVPLPAQEAIATRMADNDLATLYLYEAAGHGFYTRGDPTTIKTAHERTEKFLQQAFDAKKS